MSLFLDRLYALSDDTECLPRDSWYYRAFPVPFRTIVIHHCVDRGGWIHSQLELLPFKLPGRVPEVRLERCHTAI